MTATYTIELGSTSGTTARYAEASEDAVVVAPQPHGPVMPTVIPESDAFFWSPEWQAGERAAEEDLAMGRSRTFGSVDDLIRDLLR